MRVEESEQTRRYRRAPLIPDFLWPWVGALLALLAIIVGVLAAATAGHVGAERIEEPAINGLRDLHVPHHFWDFGRAIGSPLFFLLVVLALALWAVVRRSWPALVACATVPLAVVFVEAILKPIVDRRHFYGTTLYYPSGTSAGVAAWTTLVWLLAMPMIRRTDLRVLLTIVLGALTVLTAVSVVGAGLHFPLDAIGGVATGMVVVLGCCALIDLATGAHRKSRAERNAARARVSRE
jgi:membrane-associated phospholipid phosphatase